MAINHNNTLGHEERCVTLEESKQSHITKVFTNTNKTKISRRVETVKKVMLDKIVSDGQIPTVRNVDDIREELWKMYYQGPNTTESPTSGEEEDASSECCGHFDDFHPHELYVFFQFGPLGKDVSRFNHHEKWLEEDDETALRKKKKIGKSVLF